MIRSLIALCAAVALLVALGCGNKGPLYLPQDQAGPQVDVGSEKQE